MSLHLFPVGGKIADATVGVVCWLHPSKEKVKAAPEAALERLAVVQIHQLHRRHRIEGDLHRVLTGDQCAQLGGPVVILEGVALPVGDIDTTVVFEGEVDGALDESRFGTSLSQPVLLR